MDPVVGSCEHRSEPSVSIKCREFLEQLSAVPQERLRSMVLGEML
jgi:hypothetical protein